MKKYLMGVDYNTKTKAIKDVQGLTHQINAYNKFREHLQLKPHKEATTLIVEAANAKNKVAAELSKNIDTSSISKMPYTDLEKIELLPKESRTTFQELQATANLINQTDGDILSYFGTKFITKKDGSFYVPNLEFEAVEFASTYLENPDDIAAADYCIKVMEALKKLQNQTEPTLFIDNVFKALQYIGYNKVNNEWSINFGAINHLKLMHV